MITNSALGAWLAGAEARQATRNAIQAGSERFRRWAEGAGLGETMKEASAEGAEAVIAHARRVFAAPGVAGAALEALLACASDDPFYRPHLALAAGEVHSGLVLHDSAAVTVLIAAMKADSIAIKRASRRGGASLLFTGRRTLFHFVRAGGATLSFWEAPAIDAGFSGRSRGRCRFVKRRSLRDGDAIEVDGSCEAFVVEEATRDLVYLQAITTLGAAPLSVEYDSESLRFIGASGADEAASRTQMMLSLLRTMDRTDAVPLFEERLGSDHFYARWQSMRELLALDAAAALPHLRRMAAHDPHPEVRAAADQTLACFFAEEVPAEEMPARCRA